jgi:hypothetical protein
MRVAKVRISQTGPIPEAPADTIFQTRELKGPLFESIVCVSCKTRQKTDCVHYLSRLLLTCFLFSASSSLAASSTTAKYAENRE